MRDNKVFDFLSKIAVHNDRDWFAEHKEEYLESKEIFEKYVTKAIAALATLEPGVARLTPKECCYRFYRDTRFSTDKSPYKRHFGAYICTKGRKALRGGTYIHLQPGSSMFAFGPWWLPTNILTSCRNEILGNEEDWRKAVENDEFIRIFGHPGAAQFSIWHRNAQDCPQRIPPSQPVNQLPAHERLLLLGENCRRLPRKAPMGGETVGLCPRGKAHGRLCQCGNR